jgi:putative ABC transport system permease protein
MGWLKQIFTRRRRYGELAESIREHLEEKIEDLMEDGLSREEATRRAHREFGNVTLIEERSREVWQWPRLETLFQDLSFGARMLVKKPGFTLIAVITLALGIGANTAIFSVVNAVLLRPLPYRDPDRIVTIRNYSSHPILDGANGADFLDWREQAKVFEQVAALADGSVDLTGSGEPERLRAGMVSANLFETLGVGPAYGRAFTQAEDQPRAAHVVILSHRLWQRRFGGDPQLIGRTLTLMDQNWTVIGIMPPEFQAFEDFDLWLPLALDVNQKLRKCRSQCDRVARTSRRRRPTGLAGAVWRCRFCSSHCLCKRG